MRARSKMRKYYTFVRPGSRFLLGSRSAFINLDIQTRTRKTAIFFLILLLPFRIPFVNSAPDDGYGEANENLGQFTDTFMNETYVSVLQNVIVNITLECAELNYTGLFGDAIYNLTQLREHDWTGNGWVADVSFSIMNNNELRMLSAQSTIDLGHIFLTVDRSWLDGKYVRFRYYPYSSTVLAAYQKQYFEVKDGDYDRSSPTDFPVINWPASELPPYKGGGSLFYYQNVDGLNNWYIKDFQIDTSSGILENCTLWWWLRDDWTNQAIGLYLCWIEINSGAGGIGNLITIDFSDLSPVTMEVTGTQNDYGFCFNPELPFFEGGYETEGYFTTEDYLNYTIGNSLNLLTNSSLPGSSEITVEFSSDNVTWVDNHGDIGSSIVRAGFSALDLRDLNYSDIFMRYNLSSDGALTPRLYQSRIVTTNGTAGGAPGPGVTVIESDAPWIALAIILSIIALLLSWGYKRNE